MEPSSNSTETTPAKIAALVEGIDRRWLYLLLLVGVAGSLVFSSGVTVKTTPPVESMYEKIESLEREEGRIVLVAIDFDPQTKAENYPQAVATIRHLFKKKIPFAVLTLSPTGAGFCEEIPRKYADEYGAVYGRDWVNFSYQYGMTLFVKGIAGDVPGNLKEDVTKTPISELPAMRGVTDASSFQLVCEFTGLVGLLEMWLQYFQKGGVRPDFVHGCTAVSGPSNYTFLDSGQISGLLVGMLGAAEYEQMLDAPGRGLKGMSAQTAAHVIIILLIVAGNVAEMMRRRAMPVEDGSKA